MFLAVVVSISIPVFGEDNAVITGDGVRIRVVPSIRGEISGHLDKGKRVEVVARTDFSDTIGGRSACWYKIAPRNWVFGGFVMMDTGVDVPIVSLDSGDAGLLARFIMEGLYAFGTSRSEVKKRLGTPLSETKKTFEYPVVPGQLMSEYLLSNGGVLIKIYEWDREGCIYSTTYTTDAYEFGGLRVGSPASDIERILGHGCGWSKDGGYGFCYGQDYLVIELKIENGRIGEITFENTMCAD